MNANAYETIAVTTDRGVASVRLNRPDVRNALNVTMIAEITDVFSLLSDDDALRCAVLEGAGKMFCGGADINYMRAGQNLGEQENFEDALRLADMFAAVDACRIPVIAKIHGAALGGGVGLIAGCDIAIAADDTIFGFTEVKLGIVPAVISPLAVRKIGAAHARSLFLTGERFSTQRAAAIGLVHVVTPLESLDAAVDAKIGELRTAGPQAVRVAKELVRGVGAMSREEARVWTARTIAERRASAEGQEGLRAFLEKRKPAWH